MALVNCPECGRQNVSDSAEFCPSCGYGVRNHFAQIKQEQQREQEILNAEQRRLEEAQAIELSKELRKEQRLNSVQKPTGLNWGRFVIGIIVGIVFVLIGIYSVNESDFEAEYDVAHGNGDPHFIGPVVIIFGIVCICFAIGYLYRSIQRFRLSQSNFDEYRQLIIREQDEAIRKFDIASRNDCCGQRCPICGSYNIERLSTANRVVSIAMVGLASSKIGKQYKCKNCHHLW